MKNQKDIITKESINKSNKIDKNNSIEITDVIRNAIIELKKINRIKVISYR
jgi:hypothetical protein